MAVKKTTCLLHWGILSWASSPKHLVCISAMPWQIGRAWYPKPSLTMASHQLVLRLCSACRNSLPAPCMSMLHSLKMSTFSRHASSRAAWRERERGITYSKCKEGGGEEGRKLQTSEICASRQVSLVMHPRSRLVLAPTFEISAHEVRNPPTDFELQSPNPQSAIIPNRPQR